MEKCSVCKRLMLVRMVEEGVGVAEAARTSGISRAKAYKWLARYEEGGEEALRDRSRARRNTGRFEGALADGFLELRRKHQTWGPRKLVDWYERNTSEELPAASTVGELLKRNGLVRSRTRAPSHHPFRYAGPAPTVANARWTMDFKGQFRMGNGKLCYPFTLRDAASRKLLSIKALPTTQSAPVQAELERCFREAGLPDEIQSDGGTPFATKGLACLSKLSVWFLKLGIVPVLSRPAKPQDNGAHERMHRDLKAETTRPPAFSMNAQQRRFDEFLQVFNQQRPHEALDGDVPDEHWRPSLRAFPEQLPLPEYPGWWEVRRVNARANTITWRSVDVKVNDALGGEDIAFEPIDDGLYRVHFFRFPIGLLDERGKRPKLWSLSRERGRLPTDSTALSLPPRPPQQRRRRE